MRAASAWRSASLHRDWISISTRYRKKYDGLDGTELAISESQERMAVVVSPEDRAAFCAAAETENLDATVVAEVTDTGRLRMHWRGDVTVDISRAFLDTNGVSQEADVRIAAPDPAADYLSHIPDELNGLSCRKPSKRTSPASPSARRRALRSVSTRVSAPGRSICRFPGNTSSLRRKRWSQKSPSYTVRLTTQPR